MYEPVTAWLGTLHRDTTHQIRWDRDVEGFDIAMLILSLIFSFLFICHTATHPTNGVSVDPAKTDDEEHQGRWAIAHPNLRNESLALDCKKSSYARIVFSPHVFGLFGLSSAMLVVLGHLYSDLSYQPKVSYMRGMN